MITGRPVGRESLPFPGQRRCRGVHRVLRRRPGQRGYPGREDPAPSPRSSAYGERFVLITRTEVTDPMLIFSGRHLRQVWPGIKPTTTDGDLTAATSCTRPARPPSGCPVPRRIKRRPILGGLINNDQRVA